LKQYFTINAECHAATAARNAVQPVTSPGYSYINYKEAFYFMKKTKRNYNKDLLKVFKDTLNFKPEAINVDPFLLQKISEQNVHAIITTIHVSDELRFHRQISGLLRDINVSNF
jgi:hypothetical protein